MDGARSELRKIFESTRIARGTTLHVLPTDRWKTIFIDVFVRKDLDEDASALALLPALLRRGTARHPDLRSLTKHLDELYGATFRSDILKVGESQVLLFHFEIADPRYIPGAPPLLEAGLGFLAEVLFDPHRDARGLFPEAVIEQEKRNQVRFVEGLLNDKGGYAVERCCEEMCKGERFALYEYGDTASIRALTAESVTAFHGGLVDRAPIDIFVTGDLSVERVEKAARAVFGRERRGDLEPSAPSPHPAARPPREVFEERSVQQGKLVMGLRSGITARDEAYAALLFANGILGAYPHSKLFRVVREREGLCYYASSSIEKTKGLLLIASGIEPRHYERARELIDGELAALRAGEITTDEMETTRRAIVRGLESMSDAPTRLVTHAFGGIIAGRVEPPIRLIEAVERVRVEDVVRAARLLRLDTVYFLRPPAAVSAPTPTPTPGPPREKKAAHAPLLGEPEGTHT